MRARIRLRDEGGYTMMEMLVAMVLMAALVPAIVMLMGSGSRWGREQQEDAALQTEVRGALDRLAADFRQSYTGDATTSPVEAIGATFTFDSPDRLTPFHVRRISYRVNGSQLERASWTSTNTSTTGPPWTYPNTSAVWIKQVGSLVSGTFTYRDGNGAVTATASAVRSVDIVLVVKTTSNKPRQFTYKTTVALRETQA